MTKKTSLLVSGIFFSVVLLIGLNIHRVNLEQKKDNSFLSSDLITKDTKLIREIDRRGYFPDGAFEEDRSADRYLALWAGLHLNSMSESSIRKGLWAKKEAVFRFLLLPSFSSPYVVRINLDAEKREGVLLLKGTDGVGGYKAGKVVIEDKFDLNPIDIRELKEASSFLASNKPGPSVIDGSFWVVEVYQDGDYFINSGHSAGTKDDILPVLGCRIINILKQKRGAVPEAFKICNPRSAIDQPTTLRE